MALKPLFILGLGGAAVAAAVLLGKKPGDVVTGKSGRLWRVVLLTNVAGLKTYEVFSPPMAGEPRAELSVLRYTQHDATQASRKIIGTGAGAEALVAVAASDFGLPFNPASLK